MPARHSQPSPSRIPLLLVALLIAPLLGCSAGKLPVISGPQAIGGDLVLLEPQLRARDIDKARDRQMLTGAVSSELGQLLAARGMVLDRQSGDEIEAVHKGIRQAWARRRSSSSRLFKDGELLGLEKELAGAPAVAGRPLVFVVLARVGALRGSGGYQPIAPDEMIELPDERADYVVPQAGSVAVAGGVDLDLIVVDGRTGQVKTHRRVSHPAHTPTEILGALPVLLREVSRGLTRE